MRNLCLCTLNFSYKLKFNSGIWLDYPGSCARTVIARSSNTPNYIQIPKSRQNLCSFRLLVTRVSRLKAGRNRRLEIKFNTDNNRVDIYLFFEPFIRKYYFTCFDKNWMSISEYMEQDNFWNFTAPRFVNLFLPNFITT